jgi:hypothetical protein
VFRELPLYGVLGSSPPASCIAPVLFGTALALPQPRLFRLDSLREDGRLTALRVEDYAPRRPRPEALQQALFPYHEAWG